MQPDPTLRAAIEIDYVGSTCVLTFPPDASLDVADELRALLRKAASEPSPAVVVDLSRVAFVDSRTLGALLEGQKRIRARGGELRVVVGRREVRRIFEITLLDRAFSLHPTRAEALASIVVATPSPAGMSETPEGKA
jgi:anti-sigma B factor antagonist